MDLHMLSLSTIVIPKGRCCMFCATNLLVYWVLTQCGFLQALWFDITYKRKDTQQTHKWANTFSHPYKYILTPTVTCSHQLFVLHWMNFADIKNLLYRVPKCLGFSKITHLQKSHICWFDSVKLTLVKLTNKLTRETKNSDRNAINKQNKQNKTTHKHQTLRET